MRPEMGAELFKKPQYRDYSLTGPEGKLAVQKGLANGTWFLPHVERKARLSRTPPKIALYNSFVVITGTL